MLQPTKPRPWKKKTRQTIRPLPGFHFEHWKYDNAAKTSKSSEGYADVDPRTIVSLDEKMAWESTHDLFKNCIHDNFVIGYGSWMRLVDPTSKGIEYPACDGYPYGGTLTHGVRIGDDSLDLYETQWDLDRDHVFEDITPLPSELVIAVQNMLPTYEQVTGEFSVINFVHELREVMDLFKFWDGNSSILKNMSNGHLNWEFGWKPFLKDLQTIFTKLLFLRDFVDEWNKGSEEGKVFRHHFTMVGEETDWATEPITYHTGTWNQFKGEIYTKEITKVIAHLYFKPRTLFWDLDKYIATYKAMGLHRPIDTIWNAIPFSFVVDWFVNVGDTINQLERDQEMLACEIVSMGYSEKQIRIRQYSKMQSTKSPYQPFSESPPSFTRKTRYRRKRIHIPMEILAEPMVDERLKWKVPSLKQWLLGIELFI